MKYDVAVVGAGPSGAWTATLLARRGARVVLIDPSHPREKPCGGGITGRALALVGDAIRQGELHSVHVRAARFVESRTNASAEVTLDGGTNRLVVASRLAFDGLLYEQAAAAGADVLVTRVSGLAIDAAGVRLDTVDRRSVSASFVVGADGANGLVRRRVAGPFARAQLSIATGYFAHGVTSDAIVIEMTSRPAGYIWSFPRPDHLAIGVCCQADAGLTAESLRATVRDWIARTGLAPGARLEAYSWPIPSLSARDLTSLPLAGRGWLTVGDAAGLVDPITREGIYFALQSAAFAADAILSNDADRSRRFTDRVREEIGAELVRAARYKAGFFRPQFTHLMVDALRASGRIRAVMADLVAGVQSYRQLKWRLAATLELGLAWRLLRTGSDRLLP